MNSDVFLAAEVEVPDDLMFKPLSSVGDVGIDQRYKTKIVFRGGLRDAVYSFDSPDLAKELVDQLAQQLVESERAVIDLDSLARKCGWEPVEQPA